MARLPCIGLYFSPVLTHLLGTAVPFLGYILGETNFSQDASGRFEFAIPTKNDQSFPTWICHFRFICTMIQTFVKQIFQWKLITNSIYNWWVAGKEKEFFVLCGAFGTSFVLSPEVFSFHTHCIMRGWVVYVWLVAGSNAGIGRIWGEIGVQTFLFCPWNIPIPSMNGTSKYTIHGWYGNGGQSTLV